MDIGAVITKARNLYTNPNVLFPAMSGVAEIDGVYWVEVYVRVEKDSDTGGLCSDAIAGKGAS